MTPDEERTWRLLQEWRDMRAELGKLGVGEEAQLITAALLLLCDRLDHLAAIEDLKQ
jgi:hypothetical protein